MSYGLYDRHYEAIASGQVFVNLLRLTGTIMSLWPVINLSKGGFCACSLAS